MIIIRVGLPWLRKVRPQITVDTLAVLRAYDKTKIDFQIVEVGGTHCVRGRNISSMERPVDGYSPVRQKLSYDYYLSMDDDMGFIPETIERLIATDKDVIGASYMNRDGDASVIVAMPLNAKNKEDKFKVWEHGLKECLWTGGGCILIKKQVFEALDYPWWRNNIAQIKDENGILFSELMTEDVSFCEDARKMNYKIWVDLDNRVAHIPT